MVSLSGQGPIPPVTTFYTYPELTPIWPVPPGGTLGERLLCLRQRRGMGRRALAEVSGVSAPTIAGTARAIQYATDRQADLIGRNPGQRVRPFSLNDPPV